MLPPTQWRREARVAGEVFAVELRRTLWGKRTIYYALLAAMPLLLFGLLALVAVARGSGFGLGEHLVQFNAIFQLLFVQALLYFSCSEIFVSLIRGEVLDRTLHYAFLSPIRREALLAGKYLAGVAATALLFVPATVVSYVLAVLPAGRQASLAHLSGSGLAAVAAYAAIVVLGALSYGALCLLFGVVFRTPSYAVGLFWVWEYVSFILPPFLKRFGIAHHLAALLPLPVAEGPLAIVSETPSALASVPALLVGAAALLAVAGWRLRKLEISYGAE